VRPANGLIRVPSENARTLKLERACRSIVKLARQNRANLDGTSIDRIVSVLEASKIGFARFWLALAVKNLGPRAMTFLPRLKAKAQQLEELYGALPWDQQPQGVTDLYVLKATIAALEDSRL
jgi:hypothetical protein